MATNYREQYARYSRYFTKIQRAYTTQPKVKISVGILLSLLTISFFGVFALRPTANTIAELLAEIKSQEEIANKLTQKLNDLETAQINFSNEKQRLALLNQALPPTPQPAEFIQQLEALAASHGLTLSSLSVNKTTLVGKPAPAEESKKKSKKPKVKNTEKMGISFSTNGNYIQLQNFLKDAENLRRTLEIDSFSFRIVEEKNTESTSLAITIAGSAPYYTKDTSLTQKTEPTNKPNDPTTQ